MNENFRIKNIKGESIPDVTDAERWIDPDTFVWKGEAYRINLDFTISKVEYAVSR